MRKGYNVFYVLLTVHPGMTLVNNQFDAQCFLVSLSLFSTCFGQSSAHHQGNYCINATSGLCNQTDYAMRKRSGCIPLQLGSDINQVSH